MTDKSPLDRVLDVVVFGPAGLAITLGEEFPKLVDKGRHRVEGQVHTARLVGQFAVQFGRQKVEEWTGTAATKAESAASKASSAVSRPGGDPAPAETAAASGLWDEEGTDGAGTDAAGTDGATVDRQAPAAPTPGAPGPAANGFKPGTHLAIPGYDSLSASQVVQRLDGLSALELEEVRAHELASRRRRTILSRVEQLLDAASPGQA